MSDVSGQCSVCSGCEVSAVSAGCLQGVSCQWSVVPAGV